MTWKEKLDKINNIFDYKKAFPGYKINQWIFRIAILLILILALVFQNGRVTGGFYVFCPSTAENGCMNPFYGTTDEKTCLKLGLEYCNMPVFPPGTKIGTASQDKADLFYILTFLLILAAFILNHLLYNKGYDFKKDLEKFKEMNQ